MKVKCSCCVNCAVSRAQAYVWVCVPMCVCVCLCMYKRSTDWWEYQLFRGLRISPSLAVSTIALALVCLKFTCRSNSPAAKSTTTTTRLLLLFFVSVTHKVAYGTCCTQIRLRIRNVARHLFTPNVNICLHSFKWQKEQTSSWNISSIAIKVFYSNLMSLKIFGSQKEIISLRNLFCRTLMPLSCNVAFHANCLPSIRENTASGSFDQYLLLSLCVS